MKVNRTPLPRRLVQLLQVLNISVQTVTMLGGSQFTGNATLARRNRTRSAAHAPSNASLAPAYRPDRLEARLLRWQRRTAHNSQANLIIASGMLCMVLIVVIVVFYFSQRSFRKRSSSSTYRAQRGTWPDTDSVPDVYTVDQFVEPPQAQSTDTADGVPSDPTATHADAQRFGYVHQPPPSYESVIAGRVMPAVRRPTTTTTTTIEATIDTPNRHPAAVNCGCLLAESVGGERRRHPAYDLIKKCRQCRREIRPDAEASDDDDDDDDGDEPSQPYCACLMRNHAMAMHENVEAQRRPRKPFAAASTPQARPRSTAVRAMRPAGREDGDDNGDDGNDDENNEDDDLYAVLVTTSDRLAETPLTDSSGLPSYDAAFKLRPMCGGSN